ncbi:MAG: VWA domain-containing protein [Desulfobacter sp.]
MKFTDTYLLFLLWGLLPLAGLLVYGIRRHKKILSGFARTGMFPHILPGLSYSRRWAKAVLIITGVALAVVALAGPRAGFRWEKTTQKGVDIMIALDCSRSMLAGDVSPTRLERAKREIIDLTRLLHSDRAGLVAFAGRAVLQCPLTLDYQAFGIFLDALNPDYLPVGGTNLAAAIQACVNGFDPASDTEKAIIVITDGEDTAGNNPEVLTELVQQLAKEKIRLFTIGVGDPAGAPVPDPGGGFKKDNSGNIILSRVDEAALKKISGMANGRYVRSVAGDMDLEQIYTNDILGTMARKHLTQGRKKVWEHRFQWVLFPALILLLLELVLPAHARKRIRNRPVHGDGKHGHGKDSGTLAGALVLCCLAGSLATPNQARAGIFSSPVKQGIAAYTEKDFRTAKKLFIDAQLDAPDDLRHYYNIGTAAYAAGEFDLAEDNFAQAARSEDKALRHNALFNLANTRYRQGRLDQAVEDYESLVKAFPEDTDARENLEYLKQKQQEAQEQKQGQNNDSGDGDGDGDGDGQASEDKKGGKTRDGQQNKSSADREKDAASDPNENQDGQAQNEQAQNKQGPKDPAAADRQAGQSPDEDARQNGAPKNRPKDQPSEQDGEDASKPGQQHGPENGSGKPESEKDQAQAVAGNPGKTDTPADDAEARMLENRLNRLSDKPGMALMPGGGVNVEKDW